MSRSLKKGPFIQDALITILSEKTLPVPELGMEAVERKAHIRDFHVTLLRLLGLDDSKLTYYHAGRFKQLSQFGGALIPELVKVFTSTESRHVKEIVTSSEEGGASLNILSGLVAGNFGPAACGVAISIAETKAKPPAARMSWG